MKMKNVKLKGITLVEVIVSISLVAVVVVALAAAVTQSSVFSKSIDIVYTASYLAQRRINVLKRLDFDQISAAEETDIRVNEGGDIDSSGKYIRSTEIITDVGGNSYLTKVKVSVRRVKVNIDGTIINPSSGQMTFLGQPIIMETLFADVE